MIYNLSAVGVEAFYDTDNYIHAKRVKTSVAWMQSIFLVMNLMVFLRICCVQLAGFLKMVNLNVMESFLV